MHVKHAPLEHSTPGAQLVEKVRGEINQVLGVHTKPVCAPHGVHSSQRAPLLPHTLTVCRGAVLSHQLCMRQSLTLGAACQGEAAVPGAAPAATPATAQPTSAPAAPAAAPAAPAAADAAKPVA